MEEVFMSTPMVIHLYGAENEVLNTFTRSFVPWKILKKAVKLAEQLDTEHMSEEDVDSLASLVVAAFGDQFSVEELDNGAALDEMLTVLQQIISQASGSFKPVNPTKQA